ncbi:MAG: acyl-ACP desaturase [Bacteroidia bacterium]|nr:acyl-ACP desaturase [Bacteroidia bacterium]
MPQRQDQPVFRFQQQMEVVNQIEDVVTEAISSIMVNPDECWQPTDFLPDMAQSDAMDQVRELRERMEGVPDGVISSLIGNMITEEALPSYQTFFNLMLNEDRNLTSDRGWVRWSRAWTSEENRHGDLLNKYLYLSGRADMKKVETTIQRLIYNGFNPNTDNNPYNALIYTSFQERATKISHVNTGKLADKAGESTLSRICKIIAGDEARHEKAYKSFMTRVFELDPDGALAAFEYMMRKQITMPAALMDDAVADNLFSRFSAITQKLGIYTTWDYASIIQHLVELWRVDKLTGLRQTSAKAQDYLCTLAERYKKIAERIKAPDEINLAWLSV